MYRLNVGFKFIFNFEERILIYGRTDNGGCEIKIVNAVGYDEEKNTIKKDHIVYRTFVNEDFFIDKVLPVGEYCVFLTNEGEETVHYNALVTTAAIGKEVLAKVDRFGNFNLYERG
jgi:hypothetical protein